MPFVQIGKRLDHQGKRLFEILGCLKDFGVGRVVVRNSYLRYPEPTFYRIMKVKPQMDEEDRIGRVWVEKVFRGKNYGVQEISKVVYKWDYQLIDKCDEAKYIEALENIQASQEVKILPQFVPMPPMLKYLAEREGHPTTELKLNINKNRSGKARLAKDGETPNVDITLGLDSPASPQLYESVL